MKLCSASPLINAPSVSDYNVTWGRIAQVIPHLNEARKEAAQPHERLFSGLKAEDVKQAVKKVLVFDAARESSSSFTIRLVEISTGKIL